MAKQRTAFAREARPRYGVRVLAEVSKLLCLQVEPILAFSNRRTPDAPTIGSRTLVRNGPVPRCTHASHLKSSSQAPQPGGPTWTSVRWLRHRRTASSCPMMPRANGMGCLERSEQMRHCRMVGKPIPLDLHEHEQSVMAQPFVRTFGVGHCAQCP